MKTALRGEAVLCLALLLFCATVSFSQTKGLIYKQASNASVRNVLDPNGDGYVSKTTFGFATTQDYLDSSEIRMIALPALFNEQPGDLLTGATGGHTDLVSNNSSHAVSVLVRTVNGVQYLLVRFRIGKASTASKGYSLLLDTDQTFTSKNTKNPGYDMEVILETGNPGSVKVYSHGVSTTPTLLFSQSAEEWSQRSVASSTNNSDADYFYDFCVPFTYNGSTIINSDNFVRITAATITSAQSGIAGTISDFNGVGAYSNQLQGMRDINNSFPTGVKFSDLANPNFAFGLPKSIPPVIFNSSFTTASVHANGSSVEADGTAIKLYRKRGNVVTQMPNSSTSYSVAGNLWSASNSLTGLQAGDTIYATANVSGRDESDASNKIEVTAVPTCYTAPPVITTRNNGTVSGTWSGAVVPNGSNVIIKLYTQVDASTFNPVSPSVNGTVYYVQANGSWSFVTNIANGNPFNGTNFFATATVAGCESGYSNLSKKENGNGSGNVTLAPTINTNPLLASIGSRQVEVLNNFNAVVGAKTNLILYVNGRYKDSSTSIVDNNTTYTFNVSGLIEGDIVRARAQPKVVDYWLSDGSTQRVVTASTVQTNAPEITGFYTSGSGKTVTGICDEVAGTTIVLYQGGTNQIGTTTVNAYGAWSIENLSLTNAWVLTATAKATGKTVSATSNSVTVAASAPTAPSVDASPAIIANISTSIPGTGAVAGGTVIVYIDGEEIGRVATPAAGTWSLTVSPNALYKGGQITAKNLASGIESVVSSPARTVTGVNNFAFTNASGNNIGQQVAGQAFSTRITARDQSNATITGYTGKNTVFGPYAVISGATTGNFIAGVTDPLNPHQITLHKAAVWTLTTISVDDPTASGNSNSFTVVPNTPAKLMMAQQVSLSNTSNTAFGTQPTVQVTDAYDNVITTDNSTQITATIFSGTGSLTLIGTATVTVSSGVATFSNLGINGNGVYVLRFTSNQGYTVVNSDEFTVGKVWTGAVSTDYSTAGNWTGGVHVSGDDIIFSPTAQRDLELSADLLIRDFYNASARQLKLQGRKLTVTGSFDQDNGATIEASTAEVEMAGTAAQLVPVNTFIDNKVCRFTVNNSSGVEVNGQLDITCRMKVITGNLHIGDSLVLRSDAVTDAVVEEIGVGGSITGDIIVERYIPAKRAWRLLTAPLKNTGSVYDNWQNRGAYVSGQGILVSGPTASVLTDNGLDSTAQQNTSMMSYDPASNQWVPITNTKTTNLSDYSNAAANKGFLTFIRGDRDLQFAVPNAYGQTTVRAKGELQTGTQVFPLVNTPGALNLIGNPYACPIDLDKVYTTNSSKITTTFYYLDPKGTGLGQYITVTKNGASWDVTPSDGTTPWRTRFIQNGQAFFTQTLDASSDNITFLESHKNPAQVFLVYRPGNQTEAINVNLRIVNSNGSKSLADGFLVRFNNNFSKTVIAGEDAFKFTNYDETLAARVGSSSLSVEGRPLVDQRDTIQIHMTRLRNQQYELGIDASGFNAPGLEAFLEDTYLNTATPVSLIGTTAISFSISTSIPASFATTRFRIVFRPSGVLPVTFTGLKAYQKNGNNVQVEWSVVNEEGNLRYEVERSADGRTFSGVASVTATLSNGRYSWLDINPLIGENYYRIRSVTNGAQDRYTSIAKVALGKADGSISIYPNPVEGGILNLQLKALNAGTYYISIINSAGQKVMAKQFRHMGGAATETIQLGKAMGGGTYRIELTGEKETRYITTFLVK